MSDLMSGLAVGDVDVAGGMMTVSVINSIAAGVRMRLVGALGHLSRESCSFNGFVARTELVDSGALQDREQMRW